MIKVSIIVPIYNVEKYLSRCLDSLLVQSYQNIEVLCINDGTEDHSQQIVDIYVKDHPHFFKSYIKENGGLSDARNYGLQFARGEYIMFVDGDDFVEPEFVEEAYLRMEKDQLDLCVFDYHQYYLSNGSREVIHIPFEEDRVYRLEDQPKLLCYVGNSAWNKIYRRSLFEDNHIEYPKGFVQEDLGTTPKLLYLSERIGFIHKPLYNYLIDRPDNITQERNERIYHILDMCDSFLSFYREKDAFDRYYEELKYLSLINILYSLKKLPYFTDRTFVDGFIEKTFAFIKGYFPDFPKWIVLFFV